MTLVLLSACASNGAPVADSGGNTSHRKHLGSENEISFLKRFQKDKGGSVSAVPAVGDPEYQEYLEWKRWQDFKAYQKWKAENPGAEIPAPTSN